MRRRPAVMLTLTAMLAALALALAGCGGATDTDDRPRVVAGFYPLAYVAEQVGGDLVQVSNLTSPGVEAHDLELSARQVLAVTEADIVLHLSTLQPAVDEAAAQATSARVLDAADHVVEPHRLDDGTFDPHVWLDPRNMAALGHVYASHLGELLPDQATAVADNATAFAQLMSDLDDEYAEALRSCRISDVVVGHAAFAYLPTPFAFHPIAGLAPDAEPTPARLAELHAVAARTGITTVFTEALSSPRLAESLAADLGLGTGVLDPIEGVLADSADDYASLMRANLAALTEANACR